MVKNSPASIKSVQQTRRVEMSVVKIIELVGESAIGWEDAMKQVITEAQKTLRGITRIGVVEQDVRLINDKIDVWRVRAQVSFRVER
jgi:flavin-binding protein dodecin